MGASAGIAHSDGRFIKLWNTDIYPLVIAAGLNDIHIKIYKQHYNTGTQWLIKGSTRATTYWTLRWVSPRAFKFKSKLSMQNFKPKLILIQTKREDRDDHVIWLSGEIVTDE